MVDLLMGLQSFKLTFDSLKALSEIRDENMRIGAIADLNSKLLQLQADMMGAQQRELALAEEKRALEAECVRLKDWSAERERYELREHGERRVLAYAAKEPVHGGEPAHSLCPDCFSSTKKSILQPERMDIGRADALVCHVCGWRGWVRGNAPSPAPRRGR